MPALCCKRLSEAGSVSLPSVLGFSTFSLSKPSFVCVFWLLQAAS